MLVQSPSKVITLLHLTILYFTLFYLTLYQLPIYQLSVLVHKSKYRAKPSVVNSPSKGRPTSSRTAVVSPF